MGSIEIQSLDLDKTWIRIGCDRETGRLNRVLTVYQKALTLAAQQGQGESFTKAIVSLHDRKGLLTAKWRTRAEGLTHHKFVDEAWKDEGEHMVINHIANEEG